MLHLTKLCVGISDIAELRAYQAARVARGEALRHLTRSFPRRAEEVIDGGSIYWVISGATVVRQRVIDIREAQYQDGSRCAALHFDPLLVPVAGRPTRPFQGWRYLDPAAAPADLAATAAAEGSDVLPEKLRLELMALGLLWEESSFCEQKEAKKLFPFARSGASIFMPTLRAVGHESHGRSTATIGQRFFCFGLFTKRTLFPAFADCRLRTV